METLESNDVAIMQLGHEEEELGLCTRVFGHDLVHAFKRRHARLHSSYLMGSKLRSIAHGADVEMAVAVGPLVEQYDQVIVSVGEIGGVEEARGAEVNVVSMAVVP